MCPAVTKVQWIQLEYGVRFLDVPVHVGAQDSGSVRAGPQSEWGGNVGTLTRGTVARALGWWWCRFSRTKQVKMP